ncbi:hypothetical protein LJK87_35410 [Paenibacillus sp. P25]|nr:hypothetical protein LJK87_35410 [Paenibacillus sp. P25]
MTYLLQNLHFIFIHFPIALLLFSFVFDLLARLTKKQEWHTAGFLSLLIGTLGAVASVITGPEEARNPLFPTHELFGKLTMIWFILLSLVRLLLPPPEVAGYRRQARLSDRSPDRDLPVDVHRSPRRANGT